MKHEDPETKLIREQDRYIRILEEQLSVCKEQIKEQELLIEKQNQALALLQKHFQAGEGTKGSDLAERSRPDA